MTAKCLRWQLAGNNVNSFPHWIEFSVFNAANSNLALGSTVSSPNNNLRSYPTANNFGLLVDGVLSTTNYVEVDVSKQYTLPEVVQIELSNVADVTSVRLWVYWSGSRTYYNSSIWLSNDCRGFHRIFEPMSLIASSAGTLLTVPLVYSTSVSCDPGYYCINGTKTACPGGQYSGFGASACSSCSVGVYCPFTGMSSEAAAAFVCPAGFYCNSTGLSAPSAACVAGSYCPTNSTQPIPCPQGILLHHH
jgi:hypothetical protein